MLRKIINYILKAELYIAMSGIVILTACLFIGAVARTVNHPLSWTNDIGMMMLAWSTFLGGDIAFRSGRLANLDLLLVKFPRKVQKVIVSICYILIIAFLLLVIFVGFKLTYTTRFRTFNGVSGLSYSWVTASFPVSACFMLCTAIARYIGLMKSNDIEQISKM